ncbi:acyltransferase family protein [Neptunomonas concharum]|uniref:Acyltransferase n=1 Tax=Neptunomonas concharum TaxID=1031538 RepID=A0A5P1RC82_9GAMM|nr:acyltransferase [Neptunomonas concharum]QEQ97203.1 acyltransferase [Neptunomonas concharum]
MGLIRLILAISVLLSHMPDLGVETIINRDNFPVKVWSGHAVFAFFIISGFYVSLIINEKYNLLDKGVKRFYYNRALRLYPAHWFVLVCYIFLFLFTGVQSFIIGDFQEKYWLGVFSIFSNFLFFGSELIGFNDTSNWYYVIGPIWSLSIEAYFYILAPFLVIRPLKEILIVLGLFLLLRFSIYWSGSELVPWRYFYFPSVFVFFIMGAVSYNIYGYVKRWQFSDKVGLFLLVFLIYFMADARYWVYPDLDQMGSWFFFILVFLATPFIFIFSKNIKIDNLIGQIAYPIYISHMLVIAVSAKINVFDLDKGVVAFLLTIVVSFMIYFFIDRPIDKKYRNKISKV